MLEVGGAAKLLLVIMTFSKDILGSHSRHGVTCGAIGVVNRCAMVHVGEIKAVPINLGHRRIPVLPGIKSCLVLSQASGVVDQVAGQVLVIVGTRIGSLTPLQGRLSAFAGEEEGSGGELSALAGSPIPSQLCHRLMVTAHAGVTFHLSAVRQGLIAPVGVVVVGTDQVVSLLNHRCRAAALRGSTEEGQVEAVFVVEFLLHGEEIAGCFVEGAFGVAFTSIATATGDHQIPAFANLARADGSRQAVIVGTVGESVAQRHLFAVLRGAGAESSQSAQSAKSSVGTAKTLDNHRVAESVVQASPVGEDRTSRLRVVHQDAVNHHVRILRVVAAHTIAGRAEVVSRNGVEHVTRRVQQSGGIVHRSR